MKPIDLFIFDIAGTTVRDDGLVLHAFKTAASSSGLAPDNDWLRARMGLDKRSVFEELLRINDRDPNGATDLATRFERAIDERIAEDGVMVLPGAIDAIDALRRADVRVGFTTGFSRATADRVLAEAGFEPDVVVASDEVSRGRPAPDLIFESMRRVGVTEAARVGVAGDTPSDLGAGIEAGCAFVVGVGHGTHALEELATHAHTHLLADLTGLAALLELDA